VVQQTFYIHAQWIGNHPALRILDNTFSTSKGLKLESGKFEVSRNTFTSNSFIETIGLQGTSNFDHNDFDGRGIALHGSNNTYAIVEHNTFNNCQAALVVDQLSADLNCNEFKNGNVAIYITDGGTVIADDDASNYFYNNTVSINVSYGGSKSSLFLKDGNNEFLLGPSQQNKLHINGVFDFSESVANSLFNSTYASNGDLDVDHNYFELSTTTCLPNMPCPPSGYYSVMPVSIKVYQSFGSPLQNLLGDIQLHIPNNSSDINAICDNGIVSGSEFPMLNYIQSISGNNLGGVVNEYGKNLKSLLIVQSQNISFGSFVASDLETLDTLQTILESEISNPDNSTSELLEIAYELMLTSLEHCYTLGHLDYSINNISASPHVELSRTISLIDSQLVGLNSTDSNDHALIFKYNLDKVMSYRNGAFYSPALGELALRGNWSFSQTDIHRANYWDCIIQAESDVLSGAIDGEEYSLVREGCESTYAGFTYKSETLNELEPGYLYRRSKNSEVGFNIYPNPASDKFKIDFSHKYKSVTLSTQSGNVISRSLETS